MCEPGPLWTIDIYTGYITNAILLVVYSIVMVHVRRGSKYWIVTLIVGILMVS